MDLTIDTIVFVTVVALGGSIGALGRDALGELARVWSLTTFSTFSRDTLMLYYEGRSGLAALNVVASLLGGLAGTAIALRLGGAW